MCVCVCVCTVYIYICIYLYPGSQPPFQKNGGSFWMMINPYYQQKWLFVTPTYKRWWLDFQGLYTWTPERAVKLSRSGHWPYFDRKDQQVHKSTKTTHFYAWFKVWFYYRFGLHRSFPKYIIHDQTIRSLIKRHKTCSSDCHLKIGSIAAKKKANESTTHPL